MCSVTANTRLRRNSERSMVNAFNEIIVSEVLVEDQLFFIENMTPEVSLNVLLKTLKSILYSFTKNNHLRWWIENCLKSL